MTDSPALSPEEIARLLEQNQRLRQEREQLRDQRDQLQDEVKEQLGREL